MNPGLNLEISLAPKMGRHAFLFLTTRGSPRDRGQFTKGKVERWMEGQPDQGWQVNHGLTPNCLSYCEPLLLVIMD